MKKIVSLILLLCMVLAFAACTDQESTTPDVTTTEDKTPETTMPENTTPEITMQEIYDANQTEAIFENYQSISVLDAMDGKVFGEKYLTQEYSYVHYPDEEYDLAQFMTDSTSYAYSSGDYLCYLFIASEGVTNDFATDRAELCEPVLGADILDETIESVSQEDGRITVKSYYGQEVLANMAELGVSDCKNEYVLDAETYVLISVIRDYTFEDGTAFQSSAEVTYDAEVPEMIDEFMKYANQTEDLRKVTVISNPDMDKEVSQDFQIPKGLIVGFTYGDDFVDQVEFYTDAACTEAFDPYTDAESDLTVYVKWAE